MQLPIIREKISKYSERIYQDIFVFNSKYIKLLKLKADKSKKKSYRILFHKDNSHLTHEMMICFKKNALIPVHKHPINRSESYHILEGSMNVYFFEDDGKPIGYISLSKKKDQVFYRQSFSKFHLLVPTSKYLVYHETITGPFLKKKDIIYPKWGKKFNTTSKINLFMNRSKDLLINSSNKTLKA
jgi:glucose-6-phosphate isomerase